MEWKEIMKIPGTTKVQLSLLAILAISSVSSTGLLIYNRVNNTLAENTSTKNVSLETVKDELLVKVTGNNITEVLENLVRIESFLEMRDSVEKSYRFIPGLVK